MKKDRKPVGAALTPGRVMGLAFWTLCVCFALMTTEAKAPLTSGPAASSAPPAQDTLGAETRIRAGCEITQTMRFTRCGHSVTRRVSAPPELVGGDFAAAKAHFDLWQIESCEAERIAMSREIALFCPMHLVLTVNEAGEVVLSQNQYGDGMAVLRDYTISLSRYDKDTQEALRLGLGFDTREEAEAWLSAH